MSVVTKSKFLFDADFSPGASEADRPVPAAEHAMQLAEAESKGFKDGFAAAEKERVAEAERRTATAFEQIGDGLDRLVGSVAAIEQRLEAEAVEVAAAVGFKLAQHLIRREPFAEIAALATDCFKQLVTAPHVVVRVNDSLLAIAKERLDEAARARGFEGRLVVIAEPDIGLGDCTIEWADGGLTRDINKTEAVIAEMVQRYVAARTPEPPPQQPRGAILPELGEIPHE
jgi:flagellar assembly protein FliH